MSNGKGRIVVGGGVFTLAFGLGPNCGQSSCALYSGDITLLDPSEAIHLYQENNS